MISSTVLFGKYRICRKIGEGRAGTVFLAVHLKLGEYRAVKRVPKSFYGHDRFCREALILKELRHPGIPILYDLEEDQHFTYLIEEYLEGESLYDLVNSLGHLSRQLTLQYGVQICRIVNHLHSAGPDPILHLDLQPKNLLLCRETIKLVDFDHAAVAADANAFSSRYGTPGCAAPEQYTMDEMDERTDIYAIGVILCYLSTGTYPNMIKGGRRIWGRELSLVIGKCLKNDRRERFCTAAELGDSLETLEKKYISGSGRISSLTVALAGCRSGAGVTHLAIGLSVYLRNQGYPNLYEEKNCSGAGNELGRNTGRKRDRHGLLQFRGFVWKPRYGSCVKLKDSGRPIRILDFGPDWEQAVLECPDALILVRDAKWWSPGFPEEAKEIMKNEFSVCCLYNGVISGFRPRWSGEGRAMTCFQVPCFFDPFLENRRTRSFWREVLGSLLHGRPEAKKNWRKRRWPGRFTQKIKALIFGRWA